MLPRISSNNIKSDDLNKIPRRKKLFNYKGFNCGILSISIWFLQGLTNSNKINHLYFVSVHSLFIHRTYGCDHIVLDQQHSQQHSCSVQKYVFNDSNFLRWNKYLLFLLSHLFWFMGQHIRISWTCGTGNKRCKFRQNIKLFGLKNCSIDNMRLKCLLHPLPSLD